MAEVVGGDADFVAFGAAGRFLKQWQVGGGVADKRVEGEFTRTVVRDKSPNALEAAEIYWHNFVAIDRKTKRFRSGFSFGDVSAGHDDVPATLDEGFRGVEANA